MENFKMSRTLVLKFGGSSVSRLSNLKTIATVLENRAASFDSVIAVCSAFSGVSDKLSLLCDQLEAGVSYTGTLEDIVSTHRRHSKALGVPLIQTRSSFQTLESLRRALH